MILKKVGYRSPNDFHRWVKNNTNCSNFVVVIYVNQNGTSYATWLNENRHSVESCIVYARNKFGRKDINSAVIAHEILHLFGAWDLYQSRDAQSKRKARKAAKLLPNSIMARTDNISKLKIDELTAWLIGISDHCKRWYRRYKLSYAKFQWV